MFAALVCDTIVWHGVETSETNSNARARLLLTMTIKLLGRWNKTLTVSTW